jgi:hypothetical protein
MLSDLEGLDVGAGFFFIKESADRRFGQLADG